MTKKSQDNLQTHNSTFWYNVLPLCDYTDTWCGDSTVPQIFYTWYPYTDHQELLTAGRSLPSFSTRGHHLWMSTELGSQSQPSNILHRVYYFITSYRVQTSARSSFCLMVLPNCGPYTSTESCFPHPACIFTKMTHLRHHLSVTCIWKNMNIQEQGQTGIHIIPPLWPHQLLTFALACSRT